MTSDDARHTPDRPFRMAEPSPPMLLLYMCGTASDPHKAVRAGGKHRGKLPMVCPACLAARKANA